MFRPQPTSPFLPPIASFWYKNPNYMGLWGSHQEGGGDCSKLHRSNTEILLGVIEGSVINSRPNPFKCVKVFPDCYRNISGYSSC